MFEIKSRKKKLILTGIATIIGIFLTVLVFLAPSNPKTQMHGKINSTTIGNHIGGNNEQN